MHGLSGWVGQLFHSFNLCVCVRVCVFWGGARECHRHTVSHHRNYKNWNPVLFYSFPFKNQYRSVKKTKYSLHFFQLLALPYWAVIIMKEDLVEGWGRGALSYWDKQFFGIQTRAFYNIHILRDLSPAGRLREQLPRGPLDPSFHFIGVGNGTGGFKITLLRWPFWNLENVLFDGTGWTGWTEIKSVL